MSKEKKINELLKSQYGLHCKTEWLEDAILQLKMKDSEITNLETLKALISQYIKPGKLSEIVCAESLPIPTNLCTPSAPQVSYLECIIMLQIEHVVNISGETEEEANEGEEDDKEQNYEEQKIESRYLDLNDSMKNLEIEKNKKASIKNRMLKLIATDGVNRFAAFEHEFVECLNGNIDPGTKIIVGPKIEIRRRHILLNNLNIKIL